MSPENKLKIAAAITGKPRPPDVRAKISLGHKGKSKSAAHNAKISQTLKGRPLSEETKLKMSIARKGKSQAKIQCPHCGVEGGITMHRWHFNNCRSKCG